MYRSLGLSRADCAKFLHVTERTLHNWESGRHDIPFAAYKLLRLVTGQELPGKAWDGWSISGGKLWTPEGYGLNPRDAAWWSLLVRRAETGVQALRELARLKTHLAAAVPDSWGDGDSRAAAATAAQMAGGLVPFKTKLQGDKAPDAQCSQYDVTMTSWPILYDSPTLSTLPPVPGPTTSGSASTPLSALPLTPICGALLSLSRSPATPHLAKHRSHPPDPKSLHGPPNAHLKQNSSPRSLSRHTASRLPIPLASPGPNGASSPGCNGYSASARPSGAQAPAKASASGGAA